jgi:hypothetical protein
MNECKHVNMKKLLQNATVQVSSSSFTVVPVGFPTVGTAACKLVVPPCFGSHFSLPGALRAQMSRETSCRERGELWARNGRMNSAYNCDFHGNCKDFLHAAKLRHGTEGFTSPPKEGGLRNFSPRLNTRTWVPEASALTTRPPKPRVIQAYLGSTGISD